MTTVHGPTEVEFIGITTNTNLAYELVKHGGGSDGGHEYEMVCPGHWPPPPASADKGHYEMPSPYGQVSAVPLSVQPQNSYGGGACGEAVYESIPEDM